MTVNQYFNAYTDAILGLTVEQASQFTEYFFNHGNNTDLKCIWEDEIPETKESIASRYKLAGIIECSYYDWKHLGDRLLN